MSADDEEEETTEEAVERIKSDVSSYISDCEDDILRSIKEAQEAGVSEEDISDIKEGAIDELGEVIERLARRRRT